MASYKWMGPGNVLVKGTNPDKQYFPGDTISLTAEELDFLVRLGNVFEGVGPAAGEPLTVAEGTLPMNPPGPPPATSAPEDEPKAGQSRKSDKD